MTKSFDIPEQLVMQAYKLVKANAGAGGVDQQSLDDFESNLENNLYKIWNRSRVNKNIYSILTNHITNSFE